MDTMVSCAMRALLVLLLSAPLHAHVAADAPPSIVLLGTADALVPVEAARRWQERVEEFGGRCVLALYEDQAHGFFNQSHGDGMYAATVAAMDAFLASLGWLE